MELKTFKEINLKNEQKFVSYLMRNPKECISFPIDNILNINIKHIVQAIKNLISANLTYTHDEVLIFLSKIDSTIDKQQLENIYNAFDNFDNIEFIKKNIKETYLKTEINKQILEEILVHTTCAGELDEEKLKKLGNYLIYNVSEVNNNLKIKTSKDLSNNYINLLNEREKGIKKRSLGFNNLNKNITRPASEGEMTGLVSFKGMAKSIFTKTINNLNINNKIPVLDLDLEMTEESSVDRLMAMRGGYLLNELLMKEKITINL